MVVRIDPSDGVPIYLQLIRELKLMIAGGDLRPGDKIPSVRSLAVDLRINPNTVAKAYLELEREGIIYKKRGEGSFVSESPGDLQDTGKSDILSEKILELMDLAEKLGVGTDRLRKLINQELDKTEMERMDRNE